MQMTPPQIAKFMKNQLKCNHIHVADTLSECKGDSKKTWKLIKELWPAKQSQTNIKNIYGTTDNNTITNNLNVPLCNSGPTLASTIKCTNDSVISFNDPLLSFKLTNVNHEEIHKR